MDDAKGVKKIYDKKNKRLLFLLEKATPEFWDKWWRKGIELNKELLSVKNTWASRIVEEYVKPSEGVILEGGCGRAEQVAALSNSGYKVIGIDFAKNTVKGINELFPELDIRLADIRNIPFDNDFFVGYLSLGVIEHFWEGYDNILNEMYRVIEPGGYLFLAFPYMSSLRKIKAFFCKYDFYEDDLMPENFYQFALDHKKVVRKIEKKGFRLVKIRPFDYESGVKQEFSQRVKKVLNRLFKYSGRNIFKRIFRKISFLMLKNLANHTIMLVFQKKG